MELGASLGLMMIPPSLPPVPAPQPASANPQNNAALASAALASQKTSRPAPTQTRRAAAAVGRTDETRATTDTGFIGRAFDSEAAALHTQSAGQPTEGHAKPSPGGRGDRLNISV
jgi:hypothetical protein